jgi:hypothetical protein
MVVAAHDEAIHLAGLVQLRRRVDPPRTFRLRIAP